MQHDKHTSLLVRVGTDAVQSPDRTGLFIMNVTTGDPSRFLQWRAS